MLGEKIRKVRKEQGLTLKEIAKLTGLSTSYISQIERNTVEPSISALRKIAISLRTPIYTFLDEEEKQAAVIRKNQRKKITLPGSSISYEFLTPNTRIGDEEPQLEIIYFQLDPQKWSREEYSVHLGEESIIILSGSMTIVCGEDEHLLNEGDSIYISNGIPHKAYNPMDTVSTAIMCITPPVY